MNYRITIKDGLRLRTSMIHISFTDDLGHEITDCDIAIHDSPRDVSELRESIGSIALAIQAVGEIECGRIVNPSLPGGDHPECPECHSPYPNPHAPDCKVGAAFCM